MACTYQTSDERSVALAGNPNVGKSTVFNALTGMNQHTGNWPGKTVSQAQGRFSTRRHSYLLTDLPGTYSLTARSVEEECARDFLCFSHPEAVVVVCDATCLERNLNLVLQITEITEQVIVCVNLMDEAERKHISLNLKELEARLGVPVVRTVAQKSESLGVLTEALDRLTDKETFLHPVCTVFSEPIEAALALIAPVLETYGVFSRWAALKALENDTAFIQKLLGAHADDEAFLSAQTRAISVLRDADLTEEAFRDSVIAARIDKAEEICRGTVIFPQEAHTRFDRRMDRILTGKHTAYPLMLLLLALIFWLTVSGANVPSACLSHLFAVLQDRLTALFSLLGAPDWLHGILVLGVYRVLAWVVSVMLPPMAIFFPLFTFLEDVGYLPRIAYNLDLPFKKCHACGKQALTMCMGFGCNAVGVTGCRIIDSPRERLLAILTNSFVPCNGRFPLLIAVITVFFVGTADGFGGSVLSALLLTLTILLSIGATFLVTKLLSRTLLKGVPSSFTLELPPFRKPQVGKILIRSVLDRTLFVLGRAAAVAAPAGAIIWLMANITVGGTSLLQHGADFLDPFARLMGLDGVILIAFLLGFPANETVIPLIFMAYTAQGSLISPDLLQMKELLLQHGWTKTTAICILLFTLFHWPCSTTVLTIKKETGSLRWTLLAAALPTIIGILACMGVNAVSHLLGL